MFTLKKLPIAFSLLLLCYSCSTFKITRVGYQNLRQSTDTSCDVTITFPPAEKEIPDVLGTLTIASKPFQKNASKADAMTTLKQEACAVNANKIVISKEWYRGNDSSKAYSCTASLCREVKKQNTIPDFVNRAKSEVEIAKKQRKKMEERAKIDRDTTAPQTDTAEYVFDESWMTELKEYKTKDTVITEEVKTDSVIDLALESEEKVFVKDTVRLPTKKEKSKLEKGLFASVGYGYGGTNYAGLELEFAIDRFGIFGGAGVFGYDYGIAIHLKRNPISSYLSFMYQNVGLTEFYKYSLAGMAVNYRGKRWLTARAGCGKVINIAEGEPKRDYAPILSIGAYVPL